MKKIISGILVLAGLAFLGGVVFAQTSNIQAPPTGVSAPIPSTNTAAAIKCGVNAFVVNNDCGFGVFKNTYIQCYDGYEENLGGESSCKSSEMWQKYGQEICANRCSTGYMPKPLPVSTSVPQPLPVSKPVPLAKPIAVCIISDNLMNEYKALILALQKTEQAGDKEAAEVIIKKIIVLKQRISESQKECEKQLYTTEPSGFKPSVVSVPSATGGGVSTRATVDVNRCAEVDQWENKISYYKKLSALSDEEFKKGAGFSRTEIEKILAELAAGVEKIKTQCENQKTAEAKPTEALRQIIAEPVKPVAVESSQEIDTYYKARIGKITASGNTEEQIVKFKTLRSEIDELVVNLIKGRKEMEVSEFKNLIEEVRVSKGEIKADNVSVSATGKKIFVEVGGRLISVEPTVKQVFIKDKNLEVTAAEVSVSSKGEEFKVGNAEVKLAASDIAEKLNIEPKSVELKEQNAKAVYEMRVSERRRLFGFIPLTVSKTITADAENGDVTGESRAWYSFLTAK